MDDKLERIMESLQQLSVSVENLRVTLQTLVRESQDHELRLRVIERWRSNLTPVFALLTFIGGTLFSAALNRWK